MTQKFQLNCLGEQFLRNNYLKIKLGKCWSFISSRKSLWH